MVYTKRFQRCKGQPFKLQPYILIMLHMVYFE